jgi:beta-phosphoglucomutase
MQALVFDFNGTLSDDEPVLFRVYQELFAEVDRPITADEYFEHLAGHTEHEMFTRWLGHADPALITERIRRYNVLVADGSTVDAETRAAVQLAASQTRLGLVTSAFRVEVEPVLATTGLRALFEVVVSLDDVVKGKPDPEAYLRAADLLGVESSELVVLEDTDIGVTSAKAAGAYVVGITRTLGAERLRDADEVADRIDVALVERLCS